MSLEETESGENSRYSHLYVLVILLAVATLFIYFQLFNKGWLAKRRDIAVKRYLRLSRHLNKQKALKHYMDRSANWIYRVLIGGGMIFFACTYFVFAQTGILNQSIAGALEFVGCLALLLAVISFFVYGKVIDIQILSEHLEAEVQYWVYRRLRRDGLSKAISKNSEELQLLEEEISEIDTQLELTPHASESK